MLASNTNKSINQLLVFRNLRFARSVILGVDVCYITDDYFFRKVWRYRKFVSDLWQVDGFLRVFRFPALMQWPTEKEQKLTMIDKALHTKLKDLTIQVPLNVYKICPVRSFVGDDGGDIVYYSWLTTHIHCNITIEEEFEDTKGVIRIRKPKTTDNTMTKRKSTKGQTTIHKTYI